MRDLPVHELTQLTSIHELKLKELSIESVVCQILSIHDVVLTIAIQTLSDKQMLAKSYGFIGDAFGISQFILLLVQFQRLHKIV